LENRTDKRRINDSNIVIGLRVKKNKGTVRGFYD